MTYAAFFKSNSFRYGLGAGTAIMGAGTVYTLIKAFDFSAECSSYVNICKSAVNENIFIPKLTGECDIKNYSPSITIYNIVVSSPPELVQFINKLNGLPVHCFNGPMAIGMSLTLILSIAVATYVMCAVHIMEQDEKSESNIRQPLLSVSV